MENKITKILDSIVSTEADQFTNEGLVFTGFSIPKEIAKKNDCLKGWSQTFSMEKAVQNTEDLDQFMTTISSIDHSVLVSVYRNALQESEVLKHSLEILNDIGLITTVGDELRLTDKGICYLTTFLSLKKTMLNK